MTASGSGGQGWEQQPWPPGVPPQQPHGYPPSQQPTGYPQAQQPWAGYPPQPQQPVVLPPQQVPHPLSENPYANLGHVTASPSVPTAPGQPGEPAPLQQDSQEPASEPQVIELPDDGRTGVMIKCPNCGGTDIRYIVEARAMVCANCRSRYNEPRLEDQVDLTGGIQELEGTVVTHSSQDLAEQNMVTLKCSGCGAEVVIDVHETVQVRCHWCRSYLSPNARISNGAAPDAVAPFLVLQHDAVEIIRGFVEQRKFYAHPKFKQEFAPENVVGVYLPYFVFDGQAHADLTGQGEVQTGSWTEKHGDSWETYYSADIYNVARSFDMSVDDLLLESNRERGNMADPSQTNNIINAILPFNVKDALRYNPNYLRGFTSERRDVNITEMDHAVWDHLLSIARAKGENMVDRYDRGVRWDSEHVDLQGSRWVTVYLPVWLYSYYQSDLRLKHFVAVNGQNGNVMGSVPINRTLLYLITFLIFVIGTAIGLVLFVATL